MERPIEVSFAAPDESRTALCNGHGRLVADLGLVPVHVGALWDSAAAARACPRGPFALAFCPDSGLLYNAAFDSGLANYEIGYDNALHHSEVFRGFEDGLVERLAGPVGVQSGRIVEIGAGTGHFLARLCERGGNAGLGFDPSHDPAHADPALTGLGEVRAEYFEGDFGPRRVDLVVLRHVLEHISDPLAFMRSIRRGLGRGSRARIYVEVPNALLTVRRLSVWDLIYEHATYFTVPSLERLLASAGFEVTDIGQVYDAQFVAAHARAVDPPWTPPSRDAEREALTRDVAEFPERLDRRLSDWRARIADARAGSSPVVAWGAGAKAVGFFNMLGVGDEIPAVVDLNPRKQGHYLPGTGQPIIAPTQLCELRPSRIVVMNPIYTEEIAAKARDLHVDAAVFPV